MIEGFAAPGFEPVAQAFTRNFTELGEVGAAFAAYHRGVLVVDLWGGQADPAVGRPWRADTVQLVFSGTKGLATACVLLLVERGALALDTPAARYWPDFAAAGKQAITVGDILSHQARLPGLRDRVSLDDLLHHATIAKLLAGQAPEDDPRAAFIYHALTWGWLVDELVRRVDGRTVGEFFADEFAGPLALDAWIGLPDDQHERASAMVAAPGFLLDPDPASTDLLRVLTHNPLVVTGSPAVWNSAGFRRADPLGEPAGRVGHRGAPHGAEPAPPRSSPRSRLGAVRVFGFSPCRLPVRARRGSRGLPGRRSRGGR